jgi:small-conductance mechanosensitive channel
MSVASRTRETLQSVTGSAHAAVVRYVIVLIGAILAIGVTLALLKVPVGQLLVGGAFATIIITIAGQQSLSNVFAASPRTVARRSKSAMRYCSARGLSAANSKAP